MNRSLKEDFLELIKDKKVQIVLTGILFAIFLFSSIQIRTSNLPLLIDQTTGEYIPIALDPFYFLRVAETFVENGYSLPETDSMRYYPGSETGWIPEKMPQIVVGMWRISSIFNSDISLNYIHIISPVFFYGIGLIIFFFLALKLTNSKIIALLSSAFLAYNPSYLYRTMTGFADHEAIGMIGFFLALLIYTFALSYLEKRKTYLCGVVGGFFLGLGTVLSNLSWAGVTNFLFMIIPVSFFVFWLIQVKEKDEANKFSTKGLNFYASWIIFTILLGFVFGQGNLLDKFISSSNIASLGVLGFILLDTVLIKLSPKFIKKGQRITYSIILTAILGSLGLAVLGKNILEVIVRVYQYLISPFEGDARLTMTVAENAQPFLDSWMSNMGIQIFWLFLFGSVLFGVYLSHKIKNKKHAIGFGLSYTFMVFAIIFSKYSSGSMLNGENFLSKALYVVGFASFWVYFFKIYSSEKLKWTSAETVLLGIILYVIISGRAATRVFFTITPFVCLIAAYFVVRIFEEWRQSKEEILKIVLVSLLIISILISAFTLYSSYGMIKQQARYTGPSADAQWQKAMNWISNNTPKDAVFNHWWDYGYWVETLGDRRTTGDGGHFQGEFGNHRVGRYVLTTQNPETAYSFWKTLNVTHFLIDQTDLGKYGAYSKIGGNEDYDRFSSIPQGTYTPSQIQETKTGEILVYNIQGMVDEDIHYTNEEGGEFFLPGPTYDSKGNPSVKSYLIAILVERTNNSLKQPTAVFVYNNMRYNIPLRYVYVEGKIVDFKKGLDAVAYIIPSFTGTGINSLGGMVYLSPKVQKSLFSRVYLMDNAFEDYDKLKLVHSEPDSFVAQIKAQGVPIGEFVYYGGLRGPIKIWEVREALKDAESYEELLPSNTYQECYGCLDYLWING